MFRVEPRYSDLFKTTPDYDDSEDRVECLCENCEHCSPISEGPGKQPGFFECTWYSGIPGKVRGNLKAPHIHVICELAETCPGDIGCGNFEASEEAISKVKTEVCNE